jgi:ribosomal protein S12 methylthiotransferase accessory factor
LDDSPELTIVLADDYLNPELELINRNALSAGTPWLLFRPFGTLIWLGPLFEPSRTACWKCLAQRINANRQIEKFFERSGFETRQHEPLCSTLFAAVGCELAVMLIARWHEQRSVDSFSLRDTILVFDPITFEVSRHSVIRRPQCSSCGGNDLRAKSPQPLILNPSRKKFFIDGEHRSSLLEETLERQKRHISSIAGVVSNLSRHRDNIDGINHLYRAAHNFSLLDEDVSVLRQNVNGRSGGKGRTDLEARTAAIAEAIERYSGVFRNEEEITIRSSFRSLGSLAIYPPDCLLFSETQYRLREAWNATQTHAKFHLVPRPFDIDAMIDWTPIWSLSKSEVRYLPTSYCYYGHPELYSAQFCGADSNGCAAGNTIEEAIVQGFLELVERDGVALWWYNRVKRPRVQVDTFKIGGHFAALEEFYAKLNRNLWVIDATSDLGIPTFVAVSPRIGFQTEDIILGSGAHFDPNVALARALTEINQFLPIVRAGANARHGFYNTEDPAVLRWFMECRLETEPYLVPDPLLIPRTSTDYPQSNSTDFLEDIHTCLAATAAVGLELFCLDQTRPDVDMPVCRVVVPGLRHFWRRLAPGRLYNVPVSLGWLREPRSEEDLNPVPLFF